MRIPENAVDAFVEGIHALPPGEESYWAAAAVTCFDAWIAVEWADQPEKAQRLAVLKFATALRERL